MPWTPPEDAVLAPNQPVGTRSGWQPPEDAVPIDMMAPEQIIESGDPKKVEGYARQAEILSRTPPLGIGEHMIAPNVSAEDRELFKAVLARQYAKDQSGKEAGYGKRLAASVVQGAFDFAMPFAKRVPGSPLPTLDPDQERFRQELLSLREGLDPTIRPETSLLGRGVQQAGRMAMPMIQSVAAGGALGGAAGVAGLGRWGTAAASALGTSGSFLPQIGDQTYNSMIGEGVDPDIAWKVTVVSAPVEALVESILTNPFAGYGAAFRGTARQVAGRLLKRATVNYTKELTEEGIQRIINETALEVGRRMDETVPDQGFGGLMQAGLEEMKQAALPLALMMAPGASVGTARTVSESASRSSRLAELRAIRAKGYVAEADGIPGANRKERMANLKAEEQSLEQEIEDASQVPQDQTVTEEAGQVGQGGEVDRGGDVREPGQVGVGEEQAGEVTQAPEVPVETQSAPEVAKEEEQESDWQRETRERLAQVPAFENSQLEFDEDAGTVAVTRPDGRKTTVHLNEDAKLASLARRRGKKGAKGAYVRKMGKKGEFKEGDIYLRSDAGHDTLNHEVVHWLQDEGLISQEEIDSRGGREAMAKAYGEWVTNQQRKPNTVFQRIYDFLEGIFSSRSRLFVDIGKRGTQPSQGVTPAVEATTALVSPETQQEATQEPESVLEKAGIDVRASTSKKGQKGWVVSGLTKEVADGLRTDYPNRRLPNGSYYFTENPGEAIADIASEIAEEAEQAAAAEASGYVRTPIGTLSPEEADWYEGERADRLSLAREASSARNDSVDQLISHFVPKGRRGSFKQSLLRAEDADQVPGFDKMLEYARDHDELALPQTEGELFDLLKDNAFVQDDANLEEQIDEELASELVEIWDELDAEREAAFAEPIQEQATKQPTQAAIPGFEEEAASVERGEKSQQAKQKRKEEAPPPGKQQNLFGRKGRSEENFLFDEFEDVVGESAAESAQREAEEGRPEAEGFGFGPGGGKRKGERIRDDDIPEVIRAPDEQERRLRNARGIRKPSLAQGIRETLARLKNVTRAQEHIPNTKEFAAANEFFRLLRNVPSVAQDEAIRTTAAIVDALGPKQQQLFERYAIMENLAASVAAGQPLRFGFTSAEDVAAYRRQLQDVVARVPAVQQTIETRRKIVGETVDQLVEHGLIPPEAKENTDTYYHQQVHMYMRAQGLKRGGTRAGQTGRAFQRTRVLGEAFTEEELDYNTSYLESEISWLTDARMEIEKERLLRQLMDKYDRKPQLKQQAKKQNFENVVGGRKVANRIDAILGELAELRASEDAQDSAVRARRKQLIEELESIDPTHPYRRQIAKMAGWFRKEHGMEADEGLEPETDAEFWEMVKQEADKGNVPALALFKALHEREQFIRDSLGKKYATWESLAEEDKSLGIVQPEPGNQFYRAFTLPERIVEQLQNNVMETAELSKEDLRQVLAMAGPRRQFVVPVELATQLDATQKGEPVHGLAKLADEAMRSWKVYTLLNPKRALAYNLRNMTGDIDPVVAADTTLLRHVDKATRELSSYHRGGLKLSPELRAARDYGVVGSGFVAEEVPDIKDLAVFRRFVDQQGRSTLPLRPIKGYMDTIKPLSQWREDMLRYATFLGYRDQLRKGRVRHYGGSKKAVVDQIKIDLGVDAAAAHLARNLLGDYGNISVAGNWIRRRLMPFWSFQEINLKRVPRLTVNAYEAGGTWRAAGTMSAAAGRAILTSRIAWMYGALWAWNNLIQGGDEEEELAGYDRAVPHVILGRNPDGSIRTFRRVGALGDFLEWFGINEAVAMIGKRQAGQVETGDILKEIAFATPVKAMNSLRPDLKALYEVPTGTSLFPDPFRPRTVRRGEAVSHIFGLQDEYLWMKGWALRDGSTARPHYWQRWGVGVVDPRHSSLSQAYDLRSAFLKTKGKEDKGTFPISKYKEARDAAKFEDYGAFVDWKRNYVADRGDNAVGDFKRWLNTLDPVGSRLNDMDELEFENEFLTNEQRGRLTVARNYSHELRDLLVSWWDADDKSQALKKEVTFSAFERMDVTEPERDDYPSEAKFDKAMAAFQLDNQRAIRDIQSMTSSHDEAQNLLIDYFWKSTKKGKIGSEFDGNKLKKSYSGRAEAVAKLYGEDFRKWRAGFIGEPRSKKRAERKR